MRLKVGLVIATNNLDLALAVVLSRITNLVGPSEIICYFKERPHDLLILDVSAHNAATQLTNFLDLPSETGIYLPIVKPGQKPVWQ